MRRCWRRMAASCANVSPTAAAVASDSSRSSDLTVVGGSAAMALTRHAVIRQKYCEFAANIVSISLRLLSLGWRLGPREPATCRVTLRAEAFKVLLNSSCDKKDVWYGM